MAFPARLSIMGLYEYGNTTNPESENSLFYLVEIPYGIDFDTLMYKILTEAAELPAIYTDFGLCQKMIGVWSTAHMPTWSKLYNTTKLEYNPIENYDRQEEITDIKTNTGNVSNNYAETVNAHETVTEQGFGTDTTRKTAFNSNSPAVTDVVDNLNNSEQSISNINANSGNSTRTDNNTENVQHTARIHGNIGVTTSQQMIQSERDIATFNIYQYITDDFIDTFCVRLY